MMFTNQNLKWLDVAYGKTQRFYSILSDFSMGKLVLLQDALRQLYL